MPAYDAAVRQGGSLVLIGADHVRIKLANGHEAEPVDLGMRLAGASPESAAEFEDPLLLRTSYFIGRDPARWRTGVSNYARLRYRNVYPGVDLVYYAEDNHIEYDFIVAPGTDPSVIGLQFDGANRVDTDAAGDLLLQTAAGNLVLSKPFVYQESDGSKREVASAYSVRAMEPAGFSLGAYDPTQPLVIDPGIQMATFAGGSGFDGIESVATDNDDDIWGFGNTRSADFPAPDGQASPACRALGTYSSSSTHAGRTAGPPTSFPT